MTADIRIEPVAEEFRMTSSDWNVYRVLEEADEPLFPNEINDRLPHVPDHGHVPEWKNDRTNIRQLEHMAEQGYIKVAFKSRADGYAFTATRPEERLTKLLLTDCP